MNDQYFAESGALVDAVADLLAGLYRAPAGGVLTCAFWREKLVAASMTIVEGAKDARAEVNYGGLRLQEQWLSAQAIPGILREFGSGTATIDGLPLSQAKGGGEIRRELQGTASGWPEWQVRLRLEDQPPRSDLLRDLPRDPVVHFQHPPYLNAFHAIDDWVFGNAHSWNSTSVRSGELLLIVPDTRGRFGAAEWTADRLRLEIESNLPYAQLEAQVRFLGSRLRPLAIIPASSEIEHDVPEDAESVVAFLVHADGGHLATAQLGRWSQPKAETEEEPISVLDRARVEIGGGEGQYVEFKGFVKLKEPKESEIERTLVAFANSGGGALYVGVLDDRTLQGSLAAREASKEPDVEKALATLARRIDVEISSWIKPERPQLLVHKVELHGAPLLAVHVDPGDKVYSTMDETICVRRGATSAKASVSEIRDLFDRQVRSESQVAMLGRPLAAR